MAKDNDRSTKHVAAFLGAPVGSATLGAAIWFGFKDDCSPIAGAALQCVRLAGNEYGIGEVAAAAGILAVAAAFFIEWVME